MSRQRGSRPRPAPDQRRYREQFARPSRRQRREAPVDSGPITRRRRWAAVLGATLPLTFAFTGVVIAVVEQEENPSAASTAFAIAVALIPVTFMVLGRVSRAPQPVRATLFFAPLAIAGYLVLAWAIGEPTSPLVLSFGAAGAFVLRSEPVHRVSMRLAVVAGAALLTMLLAVLAPAAAVVLAPFLPFPALAIADRLAESRRVA